MTPNEIQKILDNGIYYVCRCGVIFPCAPFDNSKERSCKCVDVREQILTSVKVSGLALSRYLFESLIESLKQTDEALDYAESYESYAEGLLKSLDSALNAAINFCNAAEKLTQAFCANAEMNEQQVKLLDKYHANLAELIMLIPDEKIGRLDEHGWLDKMPS